MYLCLNGDEYNWGRKDKMTSLCCGIIKAVCTEFVSRFVNYVKKNFGTGEKKNSFFSILFPFEQSMEWGPYMKR
jgi:hypothetical protein